MDPKLLVSCLNSFFSKCKCKCFSCISLPNNFRTYKMNFIWSFFVCPFQFIWNMHPYVNVAFKIYIYKQNCITCILFAFIWSKFLCNIKRLQDQVIFLAIMLRFAESTLPFSPFICSCISRHSNIRAQPFLLLFQYCRCIN